MWCGVRGPSSAVRVLGQRLTLADEREIDVKNRSYLRQPQLITINNKLKYDLQIN